jgi:hypothetical protein
MTTFNAFSIFDLVGFVTNAALAACFYVRAINKRAGTRQINFWFANVVATTAAICAGIFFEDNVVPAGQNSSTFAGQAAQVLWCARFDFVVVALAMLSQVFFALQYRSNTSNQRILISPRLLWITTIVTSIVVACVVSSQWFLQVRITPAAPTATWRSASPWYPIPGAGLLVFIVLYILLAACSQHLLWHRQNVRLGSWKRVILSIPFALLFSVVGGLVDMVLGMAGWTGIAISPITTVLSDVMIGYALVREQHRQDQAVEVLALFRKGFEPAPAQRAGCFSVATFSEPASIASGDSHDFSRLDDGSWLLMLADAEGHGLGPALVASLTRGYVRAVAVNERNPCAVLNIVSRLILPELRGVHIITCFVGFLNPSNRELTYASAGQAPFFKYDASTEEVETFEAGFLPLGTAYEEIESATPEVMRFNPGDILLIPTDGCNQAHSRSKDLFGDERLVRALKGSAERGASQIVEAIMNQIRDFKDHTDLEDDMTMVLLKCLPAHPQQPPNGGAATADSAASRPVPAVINTAEKERVDETAEPATRGSGSGENQKSIWLSLDCAAHMVSVNRGEPQNLTETRFKLLYRLAKLARGKRVPSGEFKESVGARPDKLRSLINDVLGCEIILAQSGTSGGLYLSPYVTCQFVNDSGQSGIDP